MKFRCLQSYRRHFQSHLGQRPIPSRGVVLYRIVMLFGSVTEEISWPQVRRYVPELSAPVPGSGASLSLTSAAPPGHCGVVATLHVGCCQSSRFAPHFPCCVGCSEALAFSYRLADSFVYIHKTPRWDLCWDWTGRTDLAGEN